MTETRKNLFERLFKKKIRRRGARATSVTNAYISKAITPQSAVKMSGFHLNAARKWP